MRPAGKGRPDITRADAPPRGRALASAGHCNLCWQPLGYAVYNRPVRTQSNQGAPDIYTLAAHGLNALHDEASWQGAPDVYALAAHGLSLLQVVGILQQQGQVVQAAGGQGVIRPEGPLPDHQAASRQRLCFFKTTAQQLNAW